MQNNHCQQQMILLQITAHTYPARIQVASLRGRSQNFRYGGEYTLEKFQQKLHPLIKRVTWF